MKIIITLCLMLAACGQSPAEREQDFKNAKVRVEKIEVPLGFERTINYTDRVVCLKELATEITNCADW